MEKGIYKNYSSKIEDVDDKGRIVVAANAFGNLDADEDISVEGSYLKTISENFNRLRWFLNHNKEILLGVPIEAKEAYPYLRTVGQLNMKKEVSRDVYEDYKLYAEYGKSLEHSVGVTPIKRDQKDTRKVTEWKWWEYSTLTAWGANENTPMLEIKSYKDLSDMMDFLEIRLKKGNYTDEKFSQINTQFLLLKSLCIEPENSTQSMQPKSEPVIATLPNTENDELLIKQLEQINQLFNQSRWQTIHKQLSQPTALTLK